MKRYLELASALVTFAILPACQTFDAPSEPAGPPNIVVIVLDDLGFSDIGAFGGEIQTPVMDALADGGRVYTQFYVYPRCSPTRAALMTGRYPHQAGLGMLTTPEGIGAPEGAYQGYLDPELPTLADGLRAAGYRTYMSGKWHLGEARQHWPLEYGFDQYFGLISGASSYYELIEDQPRDRRMALNDKPWTPPASGFFMTDAITNKALEYLSSHASESDETPFFLYLAYTAPHWPLHASEEDIAAYDGVYDAGWEAMAAAREARGIASYLANAGHQERIRSALGSWEGYDHKADWVRRMQVHAAMVTAADRGIGEIVETLRQTGALENTLILVLSDNGASAIDVAERGLHDPDKRIGERGSYASFGEPGAIVANTPLNEYKGSVFEGGVRSPLIAHWPKQIDPEGVDTQSVFGVMDLPTTLLSLANAGSIDNAEGADLSATIIEGEPAQQVLFWEHTSWRGVRDGDLKAIAAPGSPTWQLYNLATDPGETSDLSDRYPEQIERLSTMWSDWSERVGATPLPYEQLLALFAPGRATEPSKDTPQN